MQIAPGAGLSAVFTRNAFCAAPVVVARNNLAAARAPDNPQEGHAYLLINSGNANAGTGEAGLAVARDTCAAVEALAARQGNGVAMVLPFSTGVIGELLPGERIRAALPELFAGLKDDGWQAAAEAILTTDTVSKWHSLTLSLAGGPVTVTGIAKGSGMIRPDMATMLAYVATDASVAQPALDEMLQRAVAGSFNRITVDGDMSTNDACVLVATGASGTAPASADDRALLQQGIDAVCEELARAIVRDGEGATRFIEVRVTGAATPDDARRVAYQVAQSPLVKTAFFAGDANWGRILAAVGSAGVSRLRIESVTIHLDEVCIVRDGARAPEYDESQGAEVMSRPEITVHIDLASGHCEERVWTCDLSYDYVRINAEYRT